MKNRFLLPILFSAAFVYQAGAAITESAGWLETFCLKWDKEPCAAKHNVYYRAADLTGTSPWTKIDDRLVREYKDHFRADVLGLKAGTYEARVALVNGGVEGNAMTAAGIQVTAHERTGFAFMDGVVPGAYKADGTLKDNAQIIYITDQNKNTVIFAVKTASNGSTTASTGLYNILKSVEKGYEDRPLVFRFIGRITDTDFTLDGGDISVKDNRKNTANGHITFEGVGNDAALYGLGFKTTRAANLEIRNFGIMLTNSTEGDNAGINSDSRHIWIHHNDMFYGNPGSDADQKKGDGATDVKKSTNITISYNHYWDNGKVHLLGNGGETPGYVTYHHNWYDHSDSRHPRVRQHYVHVYNNYYDGVCTYGIGATTASSIFSERNYFRSTNRPMTISMQGSDDGTFSGEDGGMIKAFGNFLDADSKKKYAPWSASNNVEFDAYEVNNAADPVPAAVNAKKGGAAYKNDILSNYPAYTSQNDSAAIRTRVKTYAGRYYGGDFTFAFNNATDDASNDVNAALKSKLQNHASELVKIQDTGIGGSVSCPSTKARPNLYAHSRGNALLTVNNAVILRTTNNASVEIFNMKGNVVRSLKFAPGNHSIPLGGLPQGLYVVKAKSASWQETLKAHAIGAPR